MRYLPGSGTPTCGSRGASLTLHAPATSRPALTHISGAADLLTCCAMAVWGQKHPRAGEWLVKDNTCVQGQRRWKVLRADLVVGVVVEGREVEDKDQRPALRHQQLRTACSNLSCEGFSSTRSHASRNRHYRQSRCLACSFTSWAGGGEAHHGAT